MVKDLPTTDRPPLLPRAASLVKPAARTSTPRARERAEKRRSASMRRVLDRVEAASRRTPIGPPRRWPRAINGHSMAGAALSILTGNG